MKRWPFLRVLSRLLPFLAACTIGWSADVTSAGAKGDGQTDDTDAIQRAVAAGGSVRFPAGTYRITRPIAIALDRTGFIALTADGTARIVMAGPGAALQFVGTHATSSAAPSAVKANVWARERAPRVDGLEIVGEHPEADGITAAGVMQLTITRVLIRETRHAIRMHGLNRNLLVSECHLYHNRIGVFYDRVNLHQTNITGSHISYNLDGGVVVRGGDVRNIQIGNCDLEANMAENGPPTANVLIDSTDGSIGEIAITGCTLQHTSTHRPGGANIRILGQGRLSWRDRSPVDEGNITITGNIMSDVAINVHLRHVRDLTFSGNTLWQGFECDLLIEDSSNIVVGPNNLDRNTRYEGQTPTSPQNGVIFRRSRDCTINGLQVNGVHRQPAAVTLENCERFNVLGATILDCDGVGLKLDATSATRVSNCLIRDDRAEPNRFPALLVTGGEHNVIAGNSLDRPVEIAPGSGISRDNDVFPHGTASTTPSIPASSTKPTATSKR